VTRVRDAVVRTRAEDAERRVAGVPLLVRTLLVLQRAGIERVMLDGPLDAPADPRIRIAVGRGASSGEEPRLVVGAGAVVDETLVRAALEARAAYEVGGVRLAVEPGFARDGAPPVGTLVSASASPRTIERALLRGLQNPRDGYLDRWLHRRLSPPVTRLLLPTALTPNQVTAIGVAIGVAGGLLLGSAGTAGVVVGVAALVVSGVLDCVDGEIARIKFAESKLGHALDVTGDTVVHAALLAGIAIRLARTGAWPGGAALGLLGVGVLGAFAAITWSERTESRRRAAGDRWENRLLDGVLSPLTTRDWYVFPVAMALAGRLDALVAAAAWGAQVFWIAVVVLVWRVVGRPSSAGGHDGATAAS
jgi:phosphatidylglycerophosphate synthase